MSDPGGSAGGGAGGPGGPGGPDLKALLGKAQEMQGRLLGMQRELARRTVEGSSGGGMVTAVVSGELRVVEIRIEPDLFAEGDREMLQDLVAAAVNAALQNAQRMVQEEMQRIAGGPLFGALGGGGQGPGGA
jgi:DNA-binding YbaB/EbfC family protein